MAGFLIISKGTEFLRVPIGCLVYVASDGNYSKVFTADGASTLVSFQLGQIEGLISGQQAGGGGTLIRVGKQLIINTDYVHRIDIAELEIVMSDCRSFSATLSASRAALQALREYLEKQQKQ